MTRIFAYTISLLFLVSLTRGMAQTGNPDGTGAGAGEGYPALQDDTLFGDTEEIPEDYFPGLRFGVNILRPLWNFAEPSKFGLELTADLNINHEYFAVAEAGFSIRDLDEPTYTLSERGMFLRIGGDRNFYRQFNDVVGIGARLGFSLYNREAPMVAVDPGYWDEYIGNIGKDTFFRQWAEVLVVLKTELFSNFYIGWTLRGKVLLFDRGDPYIEERYIPGFGVGTTRSTGGFDFYISYRFAAGS